jgi:uncharacterized protein YukE
VGAYGIPGDPAGMRALAQLVRAQAYAVDGVGRRVHGKLSPMVYSGPAASRCRANVNQWEQGRASVERALDELAFALEAEAARVEEEQRQARLEQERREQAERERAARGTSRGGM